MPTIEENPVASATSPTTKARLELQTTGAIERVDPETGNRLVVARLDDGVLSYVTTNVKVRATVVKMLEAAHVAFREQKASEVGKRPKPEAVTATESSHDWRAGLTPVQVKAMLRLRRENGFPDVDVEKTTERFKRTSRKGDKDPAYVLWLLRYKPAKFARLYGIMGEADVKKFREQKDPESLATKKIAYIQNCVITKRKTHLTEKPQLVGGLPGIAQEEGQDEEAGEQ